MQLTDFMIQIHTSNTEAIFTSELISPLSLGLYAPLPETALTVVGVRCLRAFPCGSNVAAVAASNTQRTACALNMATACMRELSIRARRARRCARCYAEPTWRPCSSLVITKRKTSLSAFESMIMSLEIPDCKLDLNDAALGELFCVLNELSA